MISQKKSKLPLSGQGHVTSHKRNHRKGSPEEKTGSSGTEPPTGLQLGKKVIAWAVQDYLEVEPTQIRHSWTKRIREHKPRSPSLHLPLEPARSRWGWGHGQSPGLAVLPKETRNHEQAKPPTRTAPSSCAPAWSQPGREDEARPQLGLVRLHPGICHSLCPQAGFPSPLLSPHRPQSKHRGAGGLCLGTRVGSWGLLDRAAGKQPQPPAWVASAALSAHGHSLQAATGKN